MGFLSVAFGSPSKASSASFLFRPLLNTFLPLSFIPTPIIYYNIGLIGMILGRELIGTCYGERMKD